MYVISIFDSKEVEQKVRDEIKKFIKNEEDFNFENLKQMKYLDWVQLETLRLSSGGVGLFDRVSIEDTYISNIPVYKNTMLNYLNKTSHYDEKNFENPK